jgi:hypothetical protein
MLKCTLLAVVVLWKLGAVEFDIGSGGMRDLQEGDHFGGDDDEGIVGRESVSKIRRVVQCPREEKMEWARRRRQAFVSVCI